MKFQKNWLDKPKKTEVLEDPDLNPPKNHLQKVSIKDIHMYAEYACDKIKDSGIVLKDVVYAEFFVPENFVYVRRLSKDKFRLELDPYAPVYVPEYFHIGNEDHPKFPKYPGVKISCNEGILEAAANCRLTARKPLEGAIHLSFTQNETERN